jgi:hypothetical protein
LETVGKLTKEYAYGQGKGACLKTQLKAFVTEKGFPLIGICPSMPEWLTGLILRVMQNQSCQTLQWY